MCRGARPNPSLSSLGAGWETTGGWRLDFSTSSLVFAKIWTSSAKRKSSKRSIPSSRSIPPCGSHHRGWQQTGVTQVHRRFRTELQATLDPAGQAMLESQSGPFASRVFTTVPYTADFTYPSHLFRVLLLRRLRLPLPLTARACRCRRALDPLGDHRAACPRSGALRSRGTPLERAAARVCREAGARVTTHTLLSDLNIPTVHRIDNRRIEVIANGLPLWGGSQLAIDTTIVSPLTSQAAPRQRRGQYAGTALRDARRSKERTYPELVQPGRCRLVVFGVETGGRWSAEAAGFLRQLAHARARQSPEPLRQAVTAALIARWSALLAHATCPCRKLVMRGHINPQQRGWLPPTMWRIPRPHATRAHCPQPNPSPLLKSMAWIWPPPSLAWKLTSKTVTSLPGDRPVQQSFRCLCLETAQYNSPRPRSCGKKVREKKKKSANLHSDIANSSAPQNNRGLSTHRCRTPENMSNVLLSPAPSRTTPV